MKTLGIVRDRERVETDLLEVVVDLLDDGWVEDVLVILSQVQARASRAPA